MGSIAQRRREPGTFSWIGHDISASPPHRRVRAWLPVLLGAILAAGLLSMLRVDILRIRYELGDALAREQALLDAQRNLTVEMRRLRDPALLGEQARELGFARPVRVIDWDGPPDIFPSQATPTDEPPASQVGGSLWMAEATP